MDFNDFQIAGQHVTWWKATRRRS